MYLVARTRVNVARINITFAISSTLVQYAGRGARMHIIDLIVIAQVSLAKWPIVSDVCLRDQHGQRFYTNRIRVPGLKHIFFGI